MPFPEVTGLATRNSFQEAALAALLTKDQEAIVVEVVEARRAASKLQQDVLRISCINDADVLTSVHHNVLVPRVIGVRLRVKALQILYWNHRHRWHGPGEQNYLASARNEAAGLHCFNFAVL